MSEQNTDNFNLSTEEKRKQIINLLEQALIDVTRLREEVRRLKAKQEVDEFFET